MEGGGNVCIEVVIIECLCGIMSQYLGVQVDFVWLVLFSFFMLLEIELCGQDMVILEVVGQCLVVMLCGNVYYVDVKLMVEEGFLEIQICFDQECVGVLGLIICQIVDVVVKKVCGDVVICYSFCDCKIDVLVCVQEGDCVSVESICCLIVNLGSICLVILDVVVDVVVIIGFSEIYCVDQIWVVVVLVNLCDIDFGVVMCEVQQMVVEQLLGVGVGLYIGGQGEELVQVVKLLIFVFGLVIFLVYLVMVLQFELLLYLFVILFIILLVLVGVILVLMLIGKFILVVVFIGLILLVGLVIKNVIILIDKVNQLCEVGVVKYEVLVEGLCLCLCLIIMIMLCMLFGFLLLVVVMGEGVEVCVLMVIIVIGGLLVLMLLMLLVILVVYDLMDCCGDVYYCECGCKYVGEGLYGDEGGMVGMEELV